MGKWKNSNLSLLQKTTISKDPIPLLEFVQQYESLPELWDHKHVDYLNKSKRNDAYLKLLKIFIKIKPNADIGAVKKKINSLRSNYRKELKKIEVSNINGKVEGGTYKPHHWLFYALHKFLFNLDGQIRKPLDIRVVEDDSVEDQKVYDSEETLEYHIETVDPNSLSDIKPLTSFIQKSSQRHSIHPPLKTNWSSISETSNACESVLSEDHTVHSTRSDASLAVSSNLLPTIVQVWGEKFVQLDPQQRIFAEKAINDILFEAGQRTLTRYSVKINER